ncbi:anaerobic ribonucleoside-triphosphate reductase activating protein [Petroclostridium sp. X23]|uniref:anaerobic ribonucleoside-triphosphate reductase activating protein n=1 Tax=Petroclostridium sp. X23 TaxID=3045146 RepID=UPI0024AD50C6|nr:anaerobic ribonucleoside-triphosphate reductase activating protein [Petroclostridium sp. X23]WHH58437.1 anaerobic ribonucleoside-triphosphate reductase activating protein [Petroclostridium sp. X23]
MKIRLAAPITKDSIVDGPGIRAVIWTQGCPHKCVGCHNPHTHSVDGGFELEVEEVVEQLSKLKLHKGITFSGGEPMDQAAPCTEIAKRAKQKGLDIWLYTGYVFENILCDASAIRPEWRELLQYVDVMIDGPFIEKMKNLLLKFRGSENQRIIDIPKSLAQGKAILFE